MSLMDFLRKIGVLRVGAKKYEYTSGRDMPAEALMDNVYDAQKDLVTGEDVQALKEKLTGTPAPSPPTPAAPNGGASPSRRPLKIFGAIVVAIFAAALVAGLWSGGGEERSAAGKKSSGATADADQIDAVFSRLRQANLDENIDEFMKYYADAFPDRAGKRQKTLATWKQNDYVSLEFFVFDLAIEGRRANASIGWEISLLEKGAKQPRLIETTNTVVLEKGGQGWQIVSLQ